MIEPRALITRLGKDKAKLGIAGALTLKITLAASSQTVKFEKKHVFQLGVGPFPMVPLNAGIDIDFSRMASLSVKYGPGTYSEYIPLGYLGHLYEAVEGEPPQDIGGEILKNQSFVNQILMAKQYSVTFESTEDFGTDFDAKLKAYNAIPDIKGAVKVSRDTKRTVSAQVNSKTFYLVGLTSMHWEDCDMK
jgi:hypothetical protein